MWGDNLAGNLAARDHLFILGKQKRTSALLFTGPDGVGKKRWAIEYCRLKNCNESAEIGCLCKNCQDASSRSPFFFALEGRFLRLAYDQLDSDMLLTTHGHRVVVVEVDGVEVAYQDRILKTIEEQPNNTTFIVLSASPSRLKQTILSRTISVRFDILSDEEFDILFEEETKKVPTNTFSMLKPKHIELLKMLCDGRPGMIHLYLGPTFPTQSFLDTIESFYAKNYDPRFISNSDGLLEHGVIEAIRRVAERSVLKVHSWQTVAAEVLSKVITLLDEKSVFNGRNRNILHRLYLESH